MDENALHRCSGTIESVHISSLHATSTSVRNIGGGVHAAFGSSYIFFIVTIDEITCDEGGSDSDKDKCVCVGG